MTQIFTADNLVSFFVLVILEVVLGIDNVIFVSIIMNRLPKAQQPKARVLWMIFGIIMRSILLMGLSWLLAQKGHYLFSVAGKGFDLSSLVMLAGGLFLIYKTVKEIHHKLEGEEEHADGTKKPLGFSAAIFQIVLIDMVFSFDSIITAGGTAKVVEVMIAAVVVAMIIMFLFSPAIAGFIHKHPTLKMLALSFLVMIGFVLLVEGWDSERSHDLHLKNYVYFAMAFSFIVELLNMRLRKGQKSEPVELKSPRLDEKP
ncbi:Membrane protein TerC, possibly involved in tellurium resistance [Filimonas lacunae]|uniref:Membrane protein TerC, possibly involved in tellurium resistance n=1 Tax=Filimonas lacunae TaxID=477680 RepID=A0A173MRY6_9BACT|nr:TerC family protein [Filimonas lacunae]BAV10108.1 integral membrane protein TerC [Filimonas lacunae]SIS84124.1 Membrane protein TerC, possibly involved in tellurium resistance [Filimonas lacunae]